MDETKKDFFHIGKMTENFRNNAGPPDKFDEAAYRVWDLRFKLAIAQQLSVISGSLSKIVEKTKE